MFAWLDKFDAWCAAIWIACISIAIYALWSAFPWFHQWKPKSSADVAAWVQAIGSVGAILIVWWQTKSQLSNEKENNELCELNNLLFINRKIFDVTQWLFEKIDGKDLVVYGLATESIHCEEAKAEKIMFLADLDKFDRRLQLASLHSTKDVQLLMNIERIQSSVQTLRLVVDSGFGVNRANNAFNILADNCEYVIRECHTNISNIERRLKKHK